MKPGAEKPTLLSWYLQRPLRERVLLLICLLVVVFFAWDLVVLEPFARQGKQIRSQQQLAESRLLDLQTREKIVDLRRSVDPDKENRERLEILQRELEKLRGELAENVVSLIAPQEVPALLRELLQKQKKLQLISLENLPAETLRVQEQGSENLLGPKLFRHRLKLEFEGDYLATLGYLRALEKLPRSLVWDRIEIETFEYPKARIQLEVYTLSLNEGWIGG